MKFYSFTVMIALRLLSIFCCSLLCLFNQSLSAADHSNHFADCENDIEVVGSIVCDEANCEFTCTWSFTGGLPASDSTATYFVVGTGIADAVIVMPGQDFSMTYEEGSAVSILVTDGNACAQNWDSYGPIACNIYTPCGCNLYPGNPCTTDDGVSGFLGEDCICEPICYDDLIVTEAAVVCDENSICPETHWIVLLDGGLPSIDTTALYTVVGGGIDGQYAPGLVTFTFNLTAPSDILLFVSDDNGCSETIHALLPSCVGLPDPNTYCYCELFPPNLGDDCVTSNGAPGFINDTCYCAAVDSIISGLEPLLNELSLSPNPVENIFTLESTDANILEVEVYDIQGQLVWRDKNGGATIYTKSTSELSSGVYMLLATLENGRRYSQKLVKR